ncbi:hypothetical protein LSM04_005769, partial [Trypanosoma melophagium]|uniref:uncharacterized protein n=1 Tax=Trypanosoma melophagium TaxID=715481 RepID=UPI00351A2189
MPRSKKWSVGAIVGIVFGVLGFLVILALILLYLLWWRPKKRREKAQEDTAESRSARRAAAVETTLNPLTNPPGVAAAGTAEIEVQNYPLPHLSAAEVEAPARSHTT